MKLSESIAIALGCISVIGLIVTGFVGEYIASIVSMFLIVIAWLIYLTSKYFQLNKNISIEKRKSELASQFPYSPIYEYIEEKPVLINKQEKRIITQSDFLNWPHFTIVFWVYIDEKIFSSNNNKYLFSYHTGKASSGQEYENAFYLGIKRHNLKRDEPEWRFIIGGEGSNEQVGMYFPSAHNLVGWKHFVIARVVNNISLYIDGGNVLSKKLDIKDGLFPQSKEDMMIYFGGWLNWKGGISNLNFYHIRIFRDGLNQGGSKDLFELEKPYMNKFKL